jgi:hypothetical protein
VHRSMVVHLRHHRDALPDACAHSEGGSIMIRIGRNAAVAPICEGKR